MDTVELGLGYNVEARVAHLKTAFRDPFRRGFMWGEVPVRSWLLGRRAREDAKANHPPTNSIEVGHREDSIIELRRKKIEPARAYLERTIQAVRAYVRAHRPVEVRAALIKSRVEARQREIETFFERRLQGARKQWLAARADQDLKKQSLEAFKRDHKLDRDARVPLHVERPIFFLLALLVADTLFNASLFEGAGGWRNAILIAAGLSASNILLGLLTGMQGLRNVRYGGVLRRRLGGVALAACVLAAVFLNLFVAHFRSVAATVDTPLDQIKIVPIMVETLRAPLAISSIMGLLLFLFSGFTFGVAIYEGYCGLDDPFPGFGDMWRDYRGTSQRVDTTAASRLRLITEGQAFVTKFFQNAGKLLRQAIELHDGYHKQVEKGIDLLDRTSRDASAFQVRTTKQAGLLLKVYREENSKFRRTPRHRSKHGLSDSPDRFSRDDINVPPELLPDVVGCRAEATDIQQLIDQNIEALRQAEEQIEEMAKEAPDRIERLQFKDADEASEGSTAA